MDYYTNLIHRYRNKGVLIDTNLLLVYCVGSFDPARILKFKRTLTFSIEDFYALEKAFEFFNIVVTTPHILTEVNNLSNQLPEGIKSGYFTKMCELISGLDEQFLAGSKICALEHFGKFGLTDSAILSLVKDKYLVLTDDFKLANYMQTMGLDVINFNHIRVMNWEV